MNTIHQLVIIDSPAMWIVYLVALGLAVTLLMRRPTRRRVIAAVSGMAGGAVIGIAAFLIANGTDAFGVDLPVEVAVWAAVALGGVGLAIVSFRRAKAWRVVVAAFSIVWFLLTGVIGINASYGLNPTVGSLFGVVTSEPVVLPTPTSTAGAPTQPLYQTWTAPAGMPAKGTRGTQAIPGTVSGFVARDAGIYLPPAALVADPPALPLVVMMMGFPGNPDPTTIGDVADAFAAQHDGLAPIVIVADQLGGDGSSTDPACADSAAYGNARTYITTDVVNWARANLNVIDDPAYRVIAGYSNGGGCAITYAAAYPQLFKNVIDVSGEQYPGSEDVDSVVATVYGGDTAAFEASKPINIMNSAPAGTYDGMTAVFTAGGDDPTFQSAAQNVSDAAKAVGMATTLYFVPGANHVGDAVSGGLTKGFEVLAPVLGFTPR